MTMSVERPDEAGNLQKEPTPPSVLPVLAIQQERPGPSLVAGEAAALRQAPVVTKLLLLLRCHQVARRTERRRWLIRLVLLVAAVAGSVALGTLVDEHVFRLYFDTPDRHTQEYRDPWGRPNKWYVKGREVSLQEYDYFRQTYSNRGEAQTVAFAAGLAVGVGVGAVLCGLAWWLTRRKSMGMSADLQEQIDAIVGGHPEAVQEWGGPAVLRQPELVAELIRIAQGSGGREPAHPGKRNDSTPAE
jgi:hypothetical protein